MRQKGSEAKSAAQARKAGESAGLASRLLEGLSDLVSRLDAVTDTADGARILLDRLQESHAASRAALYLADAGRRCFELRGSFGVDAGVTLPPIGERTSFARWLARGGGPAAIDDFYATGGAGDEDERFLAPLVEAGFSTSAPLVSRGVIVGILAYAEPRADASAGGDGAARERFLRAAATALAQSILSREETEGRKGLEQFDALKRDSLDRSCRDLQAPLRMLRSALSSLDSDDVSDSILIDMARGALSRLEETAAFARSLNGVDSVDVPLSLERTEVRSLVDDALREIIPELEEKEISVSMADETAFRCVRVDREAMATVLRSIISGVVAFAPRGGTLSVSLAVTIGSGDPDRGIELAGAPRCAPIRRRHGSRGEPLALIAIGGEGIILPGVDAASLADPFAMAASTRDERVRALFVGLGVARSIVARHEGVLSAKYDGAGSALFTIQVYAED